MESKLITKTQYRYSANLLIEPVWNRNLLLGVLSRTTISAFNRTSMESKPSPRVVISFGIGFPFNRTSMESKLQTINEFYRFRSTLLIEPVWNRNLILILTHQHAHASFNRTSMESKQSCRDVLGCIIVDF